jgi:hypothetical protein
MKENEGSKTRQMVPKRPLFQRAFFVWKHTCTSYKDRMWQEKTIYFQFPNAIKVVHTDCKKKLNTIHYGTRRKFEGPI